MPQIWDPELEFTPAEVCRLIQTQFPELSPATVELVAQGWDNTVYRVNDQYAFRFPRRRIALECLRNEVSILPGIAPLLPVAVPSFRFVGQTTVDSESNVDTVPFTGYPWLQGQPPHRVTLTDEERQTCGLQLAHCLRNLHQITPDSVCIARLPTDTIGRLDVRLRQPRLHAYLSDLHRLGEIADLEPYLTIARSASNLDACDRYPRSIVHGDLNFRNFLVHSGQLSAVIDWGDVHLGHPAVDLAVLHTFLPPLARAAFLAAYGPVDEETLILSRFRALYTTAYILVYALNIGDQRQVEEARWSLRHMIE